MLLTVDFNGKTFHPKSGGDLDCLISEIFENMDHERDRSITFADGSQAPVISPGDDAWFTFDHRRRSAGEPPAGKALLRLGANSATGYGALVWVGTAPDGRPNEIYDHIWVSDNPRPPAFDPRVVGDPYIPTFHDPRNALSIPEIRRAVEEFCSAQNGERPESIGWVHGEFDGRRPDESL